MPSSSTAPLLPAAIVIHRRRRRLPGVPTLVPTISHLSSRRISNNCDRERRQTLDPTVNSTPAPGPTTTTTTRRCRVGYQALAAAAASSSRRARATSSTRPQRVGVRAGRRPGATLQINGRGRIGECAAFASASTTSAHRCRVRSAAATPELRSRRRWFAVARNREASGTLLDPTVPSAGVRRQDARPLAPSSTAR